MSIAAPSEGVRYWVAKMKGERYAPRTVSLYLYLDERYLRLDPIPTRLGLQEYLAERMDRGLSPARHAFTGGFNPKGAGEARVRYS